MSCRGLKFYSKCRCAVKSIVRWFRSSGGQLRYRSLFDPSCEIAQVLIAHGAFPTDCVVVLAGDSIEHVQILFVVGEIVSDFTIMNPTFTAEEVLAPVDFIAIFSSF